jgi:hypothetical protein
MCELDISAIEAELRHYGDNSAPPKETYEETPWWMTWLLCAPRFIRVSGHPFGRPSDGWHDVPSKGGRELPYYR